MAIFNSNSGGSGGSSSQAFLLRAPIGTIVIWSGTADNIPTGWQLCDGTNGTPDLRDKFVLGAGTSHAVGTTGGEEKVTLTVGQMPSHNHVINNQNGTISYTTGEKKQVVYNFSQTGTYFQTQPTGSSQAHNNMPPYYALCYIMKLTADPADGVTQEELTTALADKQDTLVNGTGTTVLNNGVNINTPVQQIVTQAEFDALPEDDQNKGLWVISDGESGGGSSGGEIYSTEETKIGTWIDGKPLYRRVFEIAGPTGATFFTVYTFNETVIPKKLYGIALTVSGLYQSLEGVMCTNLSANINTALYYIPSSKNLVFRTYSGDFKNAPITIVIEYTKTTDTATQEVTT